jgi:hypothetical protein
MPTKIKTSSKRSAGARSSLARGSRLLWDSYPDDNQNTMLEAPGGTTDGESADLYYRLKQEVRCNAHVWVEASSPELMIDEEGSLTWPKKHAAKKRIQAHHDAIMRDYLSSANTAVSHAEKKT